MNFPFDNPLFIILSSTGVIFILAGYLMLKFPPKKINGFYGYRTPSSMKNQEIWDFSQKYSSVEMMKLGTLLTVCSIIGLIFKPNGKIGVFLGLGLVIFLVVFLLIRVEKAIKKKFANN